MKRSAALGEEDYEWTWDVPAETITAEEMLENPGIALLRFVARIPASEHCFYDYETCAEAVEVLPASTAKGTVMIDTTAL